MVINLVGKLIARIFEASNHTKNKIMNFQFANVSELNNGVTMHELCAAEGLAIYVSANRMKESMKKTEAEFATIIGIGTETLEDQDALNYAVNVCKRLFPHHIQILN